MLDCLCSNVSIKTRKYLMEVQVNVAIQTYIYERSGVAQGSSSLDFISYRSMTSMYFTTKYKYLSRTQYIIAHYKNNKVNILLRNVELTIKLTALL